jgi:transposase InsO family protein
VGDTTDLVIGDSGKLYLAAIHDLFSLFIVGWAVSAVNDRHLDGSQYSSKARRARHRAPVNFLRSLKRGQ